MKKAIIIGSGIGGLAAAVRLSVRGYLVEVYEKNDYPGGKLSEINSGPFRFDAGPSLFTMPEKVDELFELSGEDPRAFFNYDRLDPLCNYFYPDGTSLSASSDINTFAKESSRKTGVVEENVKKHLRKSSYIFRHTAGLFLDQSLHKWSTYLKWSTLKSFLRLPFLNIFSTMDKTNKKLLSNKKMSQLFNRYATYNGSNPFVAPGILNIIPHLEFGRGAYFPQGGMYEITKSLFSLAKSKGVKFHFRKPVSRIIVENQKATGIEIDGQKIEADIVICNSDIYPAYKNLLSDQKQPKKILSQERSSSALIFYWGINKTFAQLDIHNILFSGDYKKEFDHIFTHKDIDEDPTIYIHISSKSEKKDAPEGKENWFVMINVPSDENQDWPRLIEKAKINILNKINKMFGEDISKLIISEDILHPQLIEERTSSYRGALYGTSSNSRMAAFFRHPNFSKHIKNLYFVGGSVHPGGGIPLALSSAKIVDQMIQKS